MIATQHQEELPESPMMCLVRILEEYGLDEIEAVTVWVDLEDMVRRKIRMQFETGVPGVSFDKAGGSFFCITEVR